MRAFKITAVQNFRCNNHTHCNHQKYKIGTLLYGCITWTLGQEHFAELRTVHHRFRLRIIGFPRRQRTDHPMSYAKTLKKAQCESVETTILKRRLLFAGAVQRTHNERLTRPVMFGTMAGGENPGPGRPEKNWAQCLADLRVFRATEGCTDSVPFGVWCRNGAMAHGG